jgi:hypothetical protein
MSGQAITLTVPDELYKRLAQRATETDSSIADAALEVMAMALPTVDDLPAEIADRLAMLDTFDDQRLWRVARSTMPQRAMRRLRSLVRLQQQRTLTPVEAQELAQLLDRLEDVGLMRAKAAALLHERGHDVSALLPRS